MLRVAFTPKVTSTLTIRRLTASDRDAWLGLWRAYLNFYRARLEEDVSAETFRRLCDEDQGMAGLLARDGDERPVGLAHLVFHASTWDQAPSCYLEDLFVDRAARGAGTGHALMTAVDALARERGASRVYWLTQAFNAPARSLYDTVGRLTSFVVYERELE